MRGRRGERAGERGSGGGCVGKRRREVEDKRRRGGKAAARGKKRNRGRSARARDIYDRWARDFP